MNCLNLTSRNCEFTSFFGVVLQSERATKPVFPSVKWRTKFPTHCYSYQPKTCCIGLQHFNGSLYWGRKTYEVKSDFPEMVHAWRELCFIWSKGIHFELSICLLVECSSPHIAVPLCFCVGLSSSCCAELHGTRVFAAVSAAAQEMRNSGTSSVQLAERKRLISLFYANVNMFLLQSWVHVGTLRWLIYMKFLVCIEL